LTVTWTNIISEDTTMPPAVSLINEFLTSVCTRVYTCWKKN